MANAGYYCMIKKTLEKTEGAIKNGQCRILDVRTELLYV